MPLSAKPAAFGRYWALPMGALTAAAMTVFWGLYSIDHHLAALQSGQALGSAVAQYTSFDPSSLSDAFSGLAQVLAAVFGMVITVVSIIVQLSAERYTHVARMFMRDRVNLGVMAFYLTACITGVWLSLSLRHEFAPRVMLTAQLVFTTVGLVLMAPYFGYVFRFLDPTNIVARLCREAVDTASEGAVATDDRARSEAQVGTVSALEELTDITSNSIAGKDKIVASATVDALRDFALGYISRKKSADERWFTIGDVARLNPDFVAMDRESLADLESRRTWIEWKVMRQYLGIFNEALPVMRDINYVIAIDTRYIGEAAVAAGDEALLALVFRYMNSYLRSALNARDVRTTYNVLNQYRLLVQAVLQAGDDAAAIEGVNHMIYYGHVGFELQLSFVMETVAYDVSALCQFANEVGSKAESRLLSLLLDLDRPMRSRRDESTIIGVRKAQVKLAGYYLAKGNEENARLIGADMLNEEPSRLSTVRQSLERVTSKDFWEIVDRGRNFEYMPDAQRATLPRFFEWLNVSRATPVSVSTVRESS